MLNCVRLFGTPWTLAHQVPSVHGNSQERILEWVAPSFSKRFSQSSDQIQVSCMSPAFQADSLPLSHWGSLCIVVFMFFFFLWDIFETGYFLLFQGMIVGGSFSVPKFMMIPFIHRPRRAVLFSFVTIRYLRAYMTEVMVLQTQSFNLSSTKHC